MIARIPVDKPCSVFNMKITYIHYHLGTGGVTTVLKQQVQALGAHADTLVLTGAPPEDFFPSPWVTVPGLAYDHLLKPHATAQDTARAVVTAIRSHWPGGCDLVHVHNPILAKNRLFLKILDILCQRGFHLFLQIHDFAEDGRPRSYFSEAYPSDCHYGVINSRDYQILLAAGLEKKGLHRIPNMIRPLDFSWPGKLTAEHVLYPIRAIRRKNVGEAILLSLFLNDHTPLLITLPPNSPADIASYRAWKTFVTENKLNVRFDAGLKNSFETLVKKSRFLVTTSITEGFGFSFLEPWMAGKMLCGRRLPDICRDFEDKGIRLDHLYDRLLIPLEWIDAGRLLEKQRAALHAVCRQFDFTDTKNRLENALEALMSDDTIDFALLDEGFQKKVLVRLISNRDALQSLRRLNPFLVDPVAVPDKAVRIAQNRRAIQVHYGESTYRDTLLNIYRKVLCTPVRQRIDKQSLLLQFLTPGAFSLLKWADYADETTD